MSNLTTEELLKAAADKAHAAAFALYAAGISIDDAVATLADAVAEKDALERAIDNGESK